MNIKTNDNKETKTTNSGLGTVSGSDFWVECNVCKQQFKNWTGSTPCCGSIAYLVEDGKPTTKIILFASIGGEPIKPK